MEILWLLVPIWIAIFFLNAASLGILRQNRK